MEKTNTKDYNNSLGIKDSLSKVKAVDVAGNDILVSSGVVANSGGGCRRYLSNNRLGYNKWYRIASAPNGVNPNSVLLNVGNQYVNKDIKKDTIRINTIRSRCNSIPFVVS